MERGVNGGWSKATLAFGIIAIIFAILPLISAWFLLLLWIVWVALVGAIVCGIVTVVKKQDIIRAGIGVALCVFALLMPRMFAEQYAESAVDTASNAAKSVNDMAGNYGGMSF